MAVIRTTFLNESKQAPGIHDGKPWWASAWFSDVYTAFDELEVVAIKYVVEQKWWIVANNDVDDSKVKSIGPFETQLEALMYLLLTSDAV